MFTANICKKATVALGSVFLISGCSFSFIYNNLGWWTNWYLDDYVSLTDEQQAAFDDAFDDLHLWHRKTQLNLYAEQLTALKAEVNAGITEEQVDSQLGTFREHWVTAREKAKPELVELTYMLSPEQRDTLIENLEENNREILEEREDLSVEQRAKKTCQSQQKQFRKWIGKLTKSQKEKVCEISKGFVSTFDEWMTYRGAWLTDFKLAMSPETAKQEYERLFAELISNPDQLKSEKYIQDQAANNKVFSELFVYLMNNLTKKQKNRFNNRIDDFIEDLNDLESDS
ncbi:DUF6279 family lipoprotein [Thalassotalea euphylliae]|uniref:DUF6279 family lipoprotein n=1 Tax=Thalassotalea euphylliae TaxID=1655234 RepID=UPI003633F1B3